MATILGLDLGSNSIGWAFVDTTDSKITVAGVRVFDSRRALTIRKKLKRNQRMQPEERLVLHGGVINEN